MANIHVVDWIPKAERTTAMVNYINSAQSDKRFIYVVPDEKEAKKVRKACTRRFFTLENCKWQHALPKFKRLLNKGRNIITTRALYDLFDSEAIDLCLYQDYELILDDVVYLSDHSPLVDKDMDLMLEYYIDISDNGFATWRSDKSEYWGLFGDIKNLVCMNALAVYGHYTLLWRYPIGIFDSFENSFILTYDFKTQLQKHYFDAFKVKYDYCHVENDKIVSGLIDLTKYEVEGYDDDTEKRLEWDAIY